VFPRSARRASRASEAKTWLASNGAWHRASLNRCARAAAVQALIGGRVNPRRRAGAGCQLVARPGLPAGCRARDRAAAFSRRPGSRRSRLDARCVAGTEGCSTAWATPHWRAATRQQLGARPAPVSEACSRSGSAGGVQPLPDPAGQLDAQCVGLTGTCFTFLPAAEHPLVRLTARAGVRRRNLPASSCSLRVPP
jgi:hypothetical protein